MDPAPFLRGNPWPGTPRVAYPRANPDDFTRLPFDTWYQAQIPATVRLQFAGDATELEIRYRTETDKLGPRGESAGVFFSSWLKDQKQGETRAVLGEDIARVPFGDVVYLPEGMRPVILDVQPVGGSVDPAPSAPRWVAYGDSILEGWNASEPALAWPAIVARQHGLDVTNLGYAGAARGEIVSAEHVAELPADVISITHGTNCYTRIPHTVGMFREGLQAFLDTIRQQHATTPIVVASPVVRPDAETTPNRLGASLGDLREAMEDVIAERIQSGDLNLVIVPGRDLVSAAHLADGLHPSDEGHAALAAALGPVIAEQATKPEAA
jgi:lysophospholipase L1-like esterase